MKVLAGLAILVCAAGISPAASVKAAADPKADLSKYKTFSWFPPRVLTKSGVVESDDQWIPLLKSIVREQLLAKGLQEVKEGGDMMVSVYGLRDASAQMEAIIYPGFVNWGLGTPSATLSRYNFSGTLAVSLTDTKSKQPVWFGIASDSLKRDFSDVEKKAKKAAEKMFEKYPKLK